MSFYLPMRRTCILFVAAVLAVNAATTNVDARLSVVGGGDSVVFTGTTFGETQEIRTPVVSGFEGFTVSFWHKVVTPRSNMDGTDTGIPGSLWSYWAVSDGPSIGSGWKEKRVNGEDVFTSTPVFSAYARKSEAYVKHNGHALAPGQIPNVEPTSVSWIHYVFSYDGARRDIVKYQYTSQCLDSGVCEAQVESTVNSVEDSAYLQSLQNGRVPKGMFRFGQSEADVPTLTMELDDICVFNKSMDLKEATSIFNFGCDSVSGLNLNYNFNQRRTQSPDLFDTVSGTYNGVSRAYLNRNTDPVDEYNAFATSLSGSDLTACEDVMVPAPFQGIFSKQLMLDLGADIGPVSSNQGSTFTSTSTFAKLNVIRPTSMNSTYDVSINAQCKGSCRRFTITTLPSDGVLCFKSPTDLSGSTCAGDDIISVNTVVPLVAGDEAAGIEDHRIRKAVPIYYFTLADSVSGMRDSFVMMADTDGATAETASLTVQIITNTPPHALDTNVEMVDGTTQVFHLPGLSESLDEPDGKRETLQAVILRVEYDQLSNNPTQIKLRACKDYFGCNSTTVLTEIGGQLLDVKMPYHENERAPQYVPTLLRDIYVAHTKGSGIGEDRTSIVTILYCMDDGIDIGPESKLIVTITGKNKPPVVGDDSVAVLEDHAGGIPIDLGSLTADAEGDTPLWRVTKLPEYGRVFQVQEDGNKGEEVLMNSASGEVQQWTDGNLGPTSTSEWVDWGVDKIDGPPVLFPKASGVYTPASDWDRSDITLVLLVKQPVFLEELSFFFTWGPGAVVKIETRPFSVDHSLCTVSWYSDGGCDGSNNIAECTYDGGDCCGYEVDKQYCDDPNSESCSCQDPDYMPGVPPAPTLPTPTRAPIISSYCADEPDWISDGGCDPVNNNAECSYDGGDCCGDNVDKQYCDNPGSVSCSCLDPNYVPVPTAMPTVFHNGTEAGIDLSFCTGDTTWINDGYCDTATNNAECGYDGGDCCGDNVDTEYCNFPEDEVLCSCQDPALITPSPTLTGTAMPTFVPTSAPTGAPTWQVVYEGDSTQSSYCVGKPASEPCAAITRHRLCPKPYRANEFRVTLSAASLGHYIAIDAVLAQGTSANEGNIVAHPEGKLLWETNKDFAGKDALPFVADDCPAFQVLQMNPLERLATQQGTIIANVTGVNDAPKIQVQQESGKVVTQADRSKLIPVPFTLLNVDSDDELSMIVNVLPNFGSLWIVELDTEGEGDSSSTPAASMTYEGGLITDASPVENTATVIGPERELRYQPGKCDDFDIQDVHFSVTVQDTEGESVSQDIELIVDCTKLPLRWVVDLPGESSVIFGILCGVIGLVICAVAIYFNLAYHEHMAVRIASFRVNIAMFIGCGMIFAALLSMSLDRPSPDCFVDGEPEGLLAPTDNVTSVFTGHCPNANCFSRIWLLDCGAAITWGSLYAKTYRIKSLFMAKNFRTKSFTDKDIGRGVAMYLLATVLVLIGFSAYIGWPELELTTNSAVMSTTANERLMTVSSTCVGGDAYKGLSYVSLAAFAMLQGFSAHIAFGIRKIYLKQVNDSKQIAFAIYTSFVIGLPGIAVGSLVQSSDLSFMITVFSIFLATVTVVLSMSLPRMLDVYYEVDVKIGMTSSGSGGTSKSKTGQTHYKPSDVSFYKDNKLDSRMGSFSAVESHASYV